MTRLARRSLAYYWRTNLAVIAGVATAVAVLAGALLVGDSVRGSLRDLALARLGNTDHVVVSTGLFREQMADDIERDDRFDAHFTAIAPLVAARAVVTVQETGRQAGRVRVYGVDDRFWRFHGIAQTRGPGTREAYVSPALAEQLAIEPGAAVLVRTERPSDVPVESLHGEKDDLGRTMRLVARSVLPAAQLGEFALEAQQNDVRAIFVPLAQLQRELEVGDRVNTLLVAARASTDANLRDLEELVRRTATLGDVGLSIASLRARRGFTVGSDAGLLTDAQVADINQAVAAAGLQSQPLMTYLANTLRSGRNEIPYSLVTAIDLPVFDDADRGVFPIVINDWAARELDAAEGDLVSMDYYVWQEPGRLATATADFRVVAVVPIGFGDREMAPAYAGMSDAVSIDEWDPPFPVDLRRVRPVDERYWDEFRTTPKAFVPLAVGQQLWRSRYGGVTSVRMAPAAATPVGAAREQYAARLRGIVDPLASGLVVRDVRQDALTASQGATDFGTYFVYFSFFLVVSAVLLAALFFKLGVEQRIREVGLLRAVGFRPAAVRRLFTTEALVLSVAGAVIGCAGAVAYAALIMYGLRSWWVDAVGTTALTLHVGATALIRGGLGGVIVAVTCIWWTLRSLRSVSERSLLAGTLPSADVAESGGSASSRRWFIATLIIAGMAVMLLCLATAGVIAPAGGFFGAGAALLIAALCAARLALRRRSRRLLDNRGWGALFRLGIRSASYHPARSVLSIAVIASATFILISVDTFRRPAPSDVTDVHSGLGGYGLFIETLVPVVHDPNSAVGREALNLVNLDDDVVLEPFRLLPGDDASCLNLYEPTRPRIVAARDSFLSEGRFQFQGSVAESDAERANPWLLLKRSYPDGAVPVIADANSMTYVLHRQLGDDIVIPNGAGEIRLRLVAALRDSLFQSELVMSQGHFTELFPEQGGYQVFLAAVPAGRARAVEDDIVRALSDHGADVTSTAARLAQFHRVENTYLTTFQTLGALGMLLGTVGLATVLLRNVLERRRELALLRAVGYRERHLLLIVIAENLLLLGLGLVAGAVCAGVAIAPTVVERGGRVPLTRSGALLLATVLLAGLVSSVLAMRAATRAPLLSALRSE